jgi:hypothetical protein
LSFAELPTKPRWKNLHIRISRVDHHKEHEDDIYDHYESVSDVEDLGMFYIYPKQKFPSYPTAAIIKELSHTTQTSPSSSSLSSELFGTEKLMSQEPQVGFSLEYVG